MLHLITLYIIYTHIDYFLLEVTLLSQRLLTHTIKLPLGKTAPIKNTTRSI